MVLLVWVVPQFEQTFAQAGKALPLPTQVVIVRRHGLRQWWWAIAALAVLGALVDAAPAARPRVRGCAGTRGSCACRSSAIS